MYMYILLYIYYYYILYIHYCILYIYIYIIIIYIYYIYILYMHIPWIATNHIVSSSHVTSFPWRSRQDFPEIAPSGSPPWHFCHCPGNVACCGFLRWFLRWVGRFSGPSEGWSPQQGDTDWDGKNVWYKTHKDVWSNTQSRPSNLWFLSLGSGLVLVDATTHGMSESDRSLSSRDRWSQKWFPKIVPQ